MTRDYTQPHPQAIFREKPTHYAEVWKGIKLHQAEKDMVHHIIDIGDIQKSKYTTLFLFIIKPKKP